MGRLRHEDMMLIYISIAAKYKEYDRLRRNTSDTKSTPQKKTGIDSNGNVGALREMPANSIAATPRRGLDGKTGIQLLQAPILVEEEPTPACVRFALGPTPQKDGEVLGIFDALPAGTPSKGADGLDAVPELAVSATPSKHTASSSEPTLSRTPQSSGKRFYLGGFVSTPLKRKREDDDGAAPSTIKRLFATPSFLRRTAPLARIDEDVNEGGSTAPTFKKRGLVRSLSTIIQGLRKQEEQRMDDEWDIMRELEEEEECPNPGKAKAADVLVEDSQGVEMPLGPDQGPELSEDEADVDPGSLDANGNPRKVWKKKGQKRQTKRVKMRPVVHKPKKVTIEELLADVEAESEVVEETQDLSSKSRPGEGEATDSEPADPEDRGDESEYECEAQQPETERKSKKRKKQKTVQSKLQEGDDGKKQRKPTKVNALAHTNFRKLKIKNKNSKANGRGGRFGRR